MNSDKKFIIKLVLIIALIIAITTLSMIIINDVAFKHSEGLVYRTKTGNCYHSPGCGYLWNSAIPMGYEQAKASTLWTCSRCGSKPSGTIEVNDYGKALGITLGVELLITIAYFVIAYFYISYKESKKESSVPEGVLKSRGNPTGTTKPEPELSARELLIKIMSSLDDETIDSLVGKTVNHSKYGTGIIGCIENRKYIQVYFLDSQENKKFIYPDAFADKHLIPVDFRLAVNKKALDS